MPRSSPSNPDLFPQVEALLKPYANSFTAVTGKVKNKRDYQLVIPHQVEIAGRTHHELYFAGVIDQKGYVGFYFMPIYVEPALKEHLSPSLLKLLKGKICFYVKKLPPELRADIESALQVGLDHYVKNGWIKRGQAKRGPKS